jgi:hypothetical protein
MRKRIVFGSCVALVLAMAAVTAQQQQPAGDDQQPQSQSQPRPSATTGQQQEMTIVGCIEAQAAGTPTATDFVLVSVDPAVATGSSSTGRPSATGTSGTTSSRASAGTRYSLSGIKERELRAGQRVEIIGRSSGAQNRSTSSGSASTPSTSSSTRDTQSAAGAGQTSRTPESDRATDQRGSQPGSGMPAQSGGQTAGGTRTESSGQTASGAPPDSGRQTTTAVGAGANANMQMLEIVSYRVVPGNCNQ